MASAVRSDESGGAPGGGANVPSGGAQCGGSGGAPGSVLHAGGRASIGEQEVVGRRECVLADADRSARPDGARGAHPLHHRLAGAPAGCAAGRVPFAPTPPKPPKAGGWGIDGWT